jgi:hypothetical protein
MAINISSIGNSRDYADADLWEAGTQSGPGSGDIEIGEIYDDQDWSWGRTVIAGATGLGPTAYRHLRTASGHNFDPTDGSGVNVTYTTTANAAVILNENYSRVGGPGQGWKVIYYPTASSIFGALYVAQDYSKIEGMYVEVRRDTLDSNCFAIGHGSTGEINTEIYNNIVVILSGGSQVHWPFAIRIDDNATVANNTIYHDGVDNPIGIAFVNSRTGWTCENNIVVNCGTDFSFTGTPSSNDFNTSSDSTATGSNSNTNESATDLFNDPANDDFTLKSGSVAIDDGTSQSFTKDFAGTTRTDAWDMGAYNASGAVSVDVSESIGSVQDSAVINVFLADSLGGVSDTVDLVGSSVAVDILNSISDISAVLKDTKDVNMVLGNVADSAYTIIIPILGSDEVPQASLSVVDNLFSTPEEL